jgi:peptide-N4-(N-acetyl-beta-glucosaminyl)asparagine amidase
MLLEWFKKEFFTWCDKPKCLNCGTNQSVGGGQPTEPSAQERSEGHAGRVESY